jgi:hypothetical protein
MPAEAKRTMLFTCHDLELDVALAQTVPWDRAAKHC